MIRNLFLAALIAAFCAGLITSAFQAWRVTPLIVVAESFEGAEPAHDHATEDAGESAVVATEAHEHEHSADEWAPQDGFERIGFTVFSNIVMAAGFALIIGAVSMFFSLPITFANGLLWGVAGFAAFSLAPALGLPPGMPGMPVAETFARQLWWAGAAISTGAAMVLVAKFRAPWALAVAVVLILLPQLVAAPITPDDPSAVPPRLTAEFVSAVLYNSAIFWVSLGLIYGRLNDYFATRSAAAPSGMTA